MSSQWPARCSAPVVRIRAVDPSARAERNAVSVSTEVGFEAWPKLCRQIRKALAPFPDVVFVPSIAADEPLVEEEPSVLREFVLLFVEASVSGGNVERSRYQR